MSFRWISNITPQTTKCYLPFAKGNIFSSIIYLLFNHIHSKCYFVTLTFLQQHNIELHTYYHCRLMLPPQQGHLKIENWKVKIITPHSLPSQQGFWGLRVSWRCSRNGSIHGRPLGLALSEHSLDAPSSPQQGWRNVQWTFRQWGSARAPNRTLSTSKKTKYPKCPVDILTVRLSESAEQKTSDFS